MFNPFSEMKSKCKKDYINNVHFFNLFNTLLSMFNYDGLPKTLLPELIESNLIMTGVCGVTEINGNLYTGQGGYCGEIKNFLPIEFLITNVGIGEKRGKIGTEFAVGWNNATYTPDFSLLQYSDILTEIDVSERINVLFSRFLRIPKVKDNKEKKAIEDSIKSILNGDITAVVSDNIREILENGSTQNNFLDLVDVKEVDKLQYLNQYHDNIIKRFFQMYGHGMQNTSKLAQQTTDELHGNDIVSMILPEQRLYYRKKFVDDINSIFGTEITVDFSDTWKKSEKELETPTEESEVIENAEENKTE